MITSDTRLWIPQIAHRIPRGEPEPRCAAAGADPQALADAARANVALGAQIIDLNMGCPAKKFAAGCVVGAVTDEALVARICRRGERGRRARDPQDPTWDASTETARNMHHRAQVWHRRVAVHGARARIL